MSLLLPALLGAAIAYQLLALLACVRQQQRTEPAPRTLLPVSILKPVRGAEPGLAAALASHAQIRYPQFEILFGVHDPHDPALPLLDALIRDHPAIPMRIVPSFEQTPNRKVGILMTLGAAARHPVWVVNDGDITVPPDYLHRLVASLEDPRTGLVTCLYRAAGTTLASRLEALSIVTDFAPGVLVAPLLGVSEFGLGSTLAFRAADLHQIGGFRVLADYLADDYQLGKRIAALPRRNHLSTMVVATLPGGDTWRGVWQHQVRWARTIRVSQGGGYLGLPITYAGLWSGLGFLAGQPLLAGVLLPLRLLAAYVASAHVLRSPATTRDLWLVPVRDVLALSVWGAGLFGREVVWRDRRLRLTADGRIHETPED